MPSSFTITVPTVQSLQRQRRKADRRRAGAGRIRSIMMKGASLHLHYERGRPLWKLSTGIFVSEDVAKIVLAQPDIVDCGDSLFRNMPGQSWRYLSET